MRSLCIFIINSKKGDIMTLLNFEMKRMRTSLIVWTAAIALLIMVCLIIFPDMEDQVDELNAAFSSMGGFTAAFGMDRLNFGELMGFYGLECGNILGIGGAFFAAYIGLTALSDEEKNHTAEFLFSHPVSRRRIITEKLVRIMLQILILNAVCILTALASAAVIGEEFRIEEFLLLHLAYLLLQAETASICFCISAFLRKSGIGIGLGLAAILYFLNIIANITEAAQWLKYITPFGYAEAADIITNSRIDPVPAAIGGAVTLAGIAAAFFKYCSKDIY